MVFQHCWKRGSHGIFWDMVLGSRELDLNISINLVLLDIIYILIPTSTPLLLPHFQPSGGKKRLYIFNLKTHC